MSRMKYLAAMVISSSICGAYAQSAATASVTHKDHARKKSATRETETTVLLRQMSEKYEKLETRMEEIEHKIDAREEELKQTKMALAASNAAAAAAQIAVTQAVEQAHTAQETVGHNVEAVHTLQEAVTDLKTSSVTLAQTVQQEQSIAKADLAPESIHYKGVELRPGGFLAAETVWRRRGVGGDVNTQFTGVPFAGQSAGHLSEFNASGRQSRIALLVEGKLKTATLRGYYEADFLSAGTTSNDNQSNSYTMRQRQVWAQAELNRGITFTGGQMWSLATEYKSGLTNTKEAIPLTIDAQYNVGFTWERQYGFRVVEKINPKLSIGGSVEEAQTLNTAGHTLPPQLYQQAGNAGGLYNPTANYSYNRFPDLIAKVAYEPTLGHFELFAVGRFFRNRIFPDVCWNAAQPSPITGASCLKVTSFPTLISAVGAYNSNTDGGGIGANGRVSVFSKKLDIGVHFLAGAGVGRYSTSTLSDVTVRPDGSLVPLKTGSTLGTLEWHPTPRLDLYGYYGGEYVQRAFYLNPAGTLTGYGAPTNVTSGCNLEVAPVASANGGGNVPGSATSCTADNRTTQEGTAGYWYRFYRGSRGTLQQGFQYSYVLRNTWLGAGGAPKAIDNMWFTSFRYYLPQ